MVPRAVMVRPNSKHGTLANDTDLRAVLYTGESKEYITLSTFSIAPEWAANGFSEGSFLADLRINWTFSTESLMLSVACSRDTSKRSIYCAKSRAVKTRMILVKGWIV